METVTFQCGHCGQTVASLPENLGKVVPCPHCGQSVTAPLPADAVPEIHVPTPSDPDSIFGAPVESLSDDLFGAVTAPKVELPPEPVPNLQIEPLPLAPPPAETAPTPVAPAPDAPADVHASATAGPAAAEPPTVQEESPFGQVEAPAESLVPPPAAAPVRKRGQGGVGVPLLLIFLIPYSVMTTAATAYLIYRLRTAAPPFDPLERLPDPKPGEGGPKRIKATAQLPDKLRTPLKQPLRIGAVEVTPLAVERSPLGELLLRLKVQNVSDDTAFDPLPGEFLRYIPRGLDTPLPYSYVEIGDHHIYGGEVAWESGPRRPGKQGFDGVLFPGEQGTLAVRTYLRDRRLVEKLDAYRGPVLWRVQVRRGFVEVKGRDVSATAVIGVRLDSADIPRALPEDARLPAPRPGLTSTGTLRPSKTPEFFLGTEKVGLPPAASCL